MGQAQRSDRRGSDDRIRVIAGNGSRSSAGERARRRGTESGGLEGLELWEISRDNDNSRMMRLADREQVRSGQRRPAREHSRTVETRAIPARSVPSNGAERESGG